MRSLHDQRVLITGAGSGLGKALALHFATQGWRVAAADLNLAGAQQTASQISQAGGRALALPIDVTSNQDWAETALRVEREWGGIDVLINNAGVASAGTVEDSSIEQWQWIININLLGCVRGSRTFIPLLKRQQGGHIVNVASFAGIANPPALASYNATKAAVISLSETLRFELFPHQIGVSVACPSFFKTALMETSQQQAPDQEGNPAPQMQRIVSNLMDTATISAEDVAADIFDAVLKNRFLVITHADARQRYHLKRLAPELFFRIGQKATAKFLQKK
jgi:NAD(P)-dependent dehydrogenase (short-subunit alcohol dehydrogenase family)